MIRKLKFKVIVLSMTSLFVLLALILVGMNLINYSSVVGDADDILLVLSQNKGSFPGGAGAPDDPNAAGERDDIGAIGDGKRLPQHFSPELPYESRYFSVLLNREGAIIYIDTSRIASVDVQSAGNYAMEAFDADRERGFVGDFRYIRSMEEDAVRIIFLDCGRTLGAFRTFLYTSIFMALAGFVVVFCAICFFAGRIVRPIAESYAKQKRFITDASHEIKTPLTIINANVELLEMEWGANESLQDIQQQTKRLVRLTNDLVSLARMEEAEHTLSKIVFPVSEVVSESAAAFQTLALSQKKTLDCRIQPMLSMNGQEQAIRQLVSILLENALKYSPAESTVSLCFEKKNRTLVLSVSNPTQTTVEKKDLHHVFERFYRTDLSRNSKTGGHGIGLSVAKAIVTAHGGRIEAWSKGEHLFGITAVFAA